MKDNHVSEETIAGYLAGTLSECQAGDVETHLATCDRCAGMAFRSNQFDTAWGDWNAETHAQASREGPGFVAARIGDALASFARAKSEWKERLSGWASDLTSLTDAGFTPAPEAIPVRGGKAAMVELQREPGRGGAHLRLQEASDVVAYVAGTTAPDLGPALVMLCAMSAGSADPQINVLHFLPEENAWTTRFERVPAGEYALALELNPPPAI
jgi:hypothetical protein